MGKLIRFLAVIVVGSLVTSASAVLLAPQVGSMLTANDVADVSEIELTPLAQRSVVLAADGSLYTVLFDDQNRRSVPLREMPRVLIDTVLAVEDEHFFEHQGVNLRSTMRAMFANLSAGDIEQGGSTITQQLVKNSTDVGLDQTMDRKVKEAVLAVRLEDQLTKREILERYLNTVYLGNGTYGVQAAAELYFAKDAKDLDLVESAFLAGVIQSPEFLNPFTHAERVRERRGEVVGRLRAVGNIDEDEAKFINASPLPTEPNRFPAPNDPFIKEVRRQILRDERLGATAAERRDRVFTGGLTIQTTIDPRLQTFATAAAAFGNPRPEDIAVAIASVEPSTGAVRAMAGQVERGGTELDLLTGDGRQPGSSLKPFLLAAYLEESGSPNDTVSGSAPCRFPNPGGNPDPYEATNYAESGGGGMMDLRRATTTSNNCAYLNLAQTVGLEKSREVAERFGLRFNDFTLASALGTTDVNPVEQAAAYAVFANNGVFNPWYLIERIVDREGETIVAHEPTPRQVVSAETAAIVTDVLADNVTRGTGTAARFSDGRPAAGKTGTTQNHIDAWFAGYIPQMSTAVWLGNPAGGQIAMEPIAGRRVTGGGFAAPIWGGYMHASFDEIPPQPFAEMPPVRPGTRIMSPLERLAAAEQQARERDRQAQQQRERDRRATEEAARRPRVTAPPAPQRPAPQPQPPEPSRPDRAPGGGGASNPPPLTPPGGDDDGD